MKRAVAVADRTMLTASLPARMVTSNRRGVSSSLSTVEKKGKRSSHLVQVKGRQGEEGGLGGRKEARQKQAQSHQDKFECSVWVQALAYPG